MAFGSSKHATGTSVAKAQSPVFFDPLFNHARLRLNKLRAPGKLHQRKTHPGLLADDGCSKFFQIIIRDRADPTYDSESD